MWSIEKTKYATVAKDGLRQIVVCNEECLLVDRSQGAIKISALAKWPSIVTVTPFVCEALWAAEMAYEEQV